MQANIIEPASSGYRRLHVRDSRQCFQCGAVAGRCEHLSAEHGVVEVWTKPGMRPGEARWSESEVNILRRLWLKGNSSAEIANQLNRSIHAVKSKLASEGLFGLQGTAA